MRALNWLWRGFLFFVLFAFALNNQQLAQLNWFFGYSWEAPMVFVVLGAFALGCVTGVLAMVPSWWRQRRDARKRLQMMGEPAAATPKQDKHAVQQDNPTTVPAPLPFPPDVAAPRKSGR